MKSKFSNCAEFGGDKLSGYLDGMLDGETLRRVDAHLRDCAACRDELGRLDQVKSMLRSSVSPAAPTAFWADTYRRARVEAGEAKQRRLPAWLDPTRRLGVLAGSASLAALIVTGLFFTVPANQQPRDVEALADVVDVTSMVKAHADYVAGKNLVDGSRNRIIRSEIVTLASGDPVPTDLSDPEAVANAAAD